MKHYRYMLLGICMAATLGGCSGSVRDVLGIRKKAPDEFNVLSTGPLVVPSEFDLVEPGTAPSFRPVNDKTIQDARDLLLNSSKPKAGIASTDETLSPGSKALIEQIGQGSPSDIRQQVDKEYQEKKERTEWVDTVLPWRHRNNKELINPAEEFERINQKPHPVTSPTPPPYAVDKEKE